MAFTPVQIKPNPGIQRDGTDFDCDQFIDGNWVRFYRDRPKKMGGYRAIVTDLNEVVRGMSSYTRAGLTYMHLGSAGTVFQVLIDSNGLPAGETDRTPAGFVSNASRLWQFEVFYDSASGNNKIIAHGPPNLDISNSTTSPIYYGDATAVAALTDTAVVNESGGIVAVPPYLFKFGNDGHIAWSVPNKPNDFTNTGSGEAWVTAQKIIKGFPLRGGGNGPAAIFWSLDSIVRGSFVGTASGVWAFDTLASEISVLSSQGIIEYDGTFYWAGVDRFMQFNGVPRELENTTNLNWFFNNLNIAQRQKVFAFKNPRYGEIWWCFPSGTATECTHAVIFNVRKNIWYDTVLPDGGRSSGVFAKVYNKPFMVGSVLSGGHYTLWQHETGLNKTIGIMEQAITSWFQTNEISLIGASDQAQNKSLTVAKVEPDFVQVGQLVFSVLHRANARATAIETTSVVIPQLPVADPLDQMTGVSVDDRLVSFRFESNVAGGDYEMGKTLVYVAPGDAFELQ